MINQKIKCESCLHRIHLRNTGQGGASWSKNCKQCDRNFNHMMQFLTTLKTNKNEKQKRKR